MDKVKNWKRELAEDVGIIALALMVLWAGGVGIQLYLGTPTPFLAVESGSMEPVLYRGDLVIVRAVDPSTLQVGDIIIFDSPHSNVSIVHRIIEIQNASGSIEFVTKGDNNPLPDYDHTVASDVRAKVIGTIRYLGFLTLLLLLPGSVAYIFGVFFLIVVISLLYEVLMPKADAEKLEKFSSESEN